ncbi:hypothetical protein [Gilvimarinus sp. DA14]|uniref:hypothetical protein n=1 Tax=Gilvimarinus sp. DA14 TaxID=2956798 RepID=UPI0020B858B3|nr:hypothetical protein [Gilvimarinus sp. DA14]UTF61215.1 hypothetical protein NHM04_05290 [Gilvimarinus sp. DA14]
MKISKALLAISAITLAGCGSGSGSSGGDTGESNGGQRGNIEDRPISISESDREMTIIEIVGDSIMKQTIPAYRGFPMEFTLNGLVDERFELTDIEGCGGVRSMNPDAPLVSQYETVHNVPGDCTVTATYSLASETPHLISVDLEGYGTSISPMDLSVPSGESAYLFVSREPGYDLNITGCNGLLNEDTYVIESVTENCKITAESTPTSAEQVIITTSATAGARIEPSIATVNSGDQVAFDIESGYGFTAEVTGCDGTFSEGSYQFTATGDCTINVVSLPDSDNPILTIETSNNEPVFLKIVDENGWENPVLTTIPHVVLRKSIESMDIQLVKPSGSILYSADGCHRDPYHNEIIHDGIINLYDELPLIQNDCALTLETRVSDYTPVGTASLSKFFTETMENEEITKIAFVGTASQFTIDEPNKSVDELNGHYLCEYRRDGNLVTVYHNQTYTNWNSPNAGLSELCWATIDLE